MFKIWHLFVFTGILNKTLGTKVIQNSVIYNSNPKYANVTATLGRHKNNDTYFNSTITTLEDLAKMMV